MEKYIALIEDDKDVAEFLSQKMEGAGLAVRLCYNGEDGLQTALSESCYLVTMDLIIPGLMGVDLIKKVREKRPDLPIVVISGAGPTEISDAINAGANLIIEKPVDDKELLKHLFDFMESD